MLPGGECVTGERRRTVVRRRPCILERDPMMPERHTPIVSRRPFIDWSSGSIVWSPGTNLSRLSFGGRERLSIPEGNPDQGFWPMSVPVDVGLIVGLRTHDLSSRPWIDSRVGTIPSGLGTIPRPLGSIAKRETFIATRETIVPERETIVPGRETIVPKHDTSVDRRPTSVPTCELPVATRSGSHVRDRTRRAKRVAFETAARGCEASALGVARHPRGEGSPASILQSQANGDRSPTPGDRPSRPILLPKALTHRSITPSGPPFRPNRGDWPRGQRGATRIHVG